MYLAAPLFLIVCSGALWFFHEIDRPLRSRSASPKEVLIAIGLGFISAAVATFAVSLLVPLDITVRLSVALVAFFGSTCFSLRRLDHARVESFRKKQTGLVDRFVAGNLIGVSPLTVLNEAAASSSIADRLILLEIHRTVVFMTRKSMSGASRSERTQASIDAGLRGEINAFATRIGEIAESQQNQRDQFIQWKSELQKAAELRHRSGQLMRPVLAQAILMGGLFIVLAVMGLLFFQVDDVIEAVRLASPLILTGVFWFRRIGRSVRWTL